MLIVRLKGANDFGCSVFRCSVFRRERTLDETIQHQFIARLRCTIEPVGYIISKPLQGMVPHAKRPGEITGETLAGVRAPVDSTGGSSPLNSEH